MKIIKYYKNTHLFFLVIIIGFSVFNNVYAENIIIRLSIEEGKHTTLTQVQSNPIKYYKEELEYKLQMQIGSYNLKLAETSETIKDGIKEKAKRERVFDFIGINENNFSEIKEVGNKITAKYIYSDFDIENVQNLIKRKLEEVKKEIKNCNNENIEALEAIVNSIKLMNFSMEGSINEKVIEVKRIALDMRDSIINSVNKKYAIELEKLNRIDSLMNAVIIDKLEILLGGYEIQIVNQKKMLDGQEELIGNWEKQLSQKMVILYTMLLNWIVMAIFWYWEKSYKYHGTNLVYHKSKKDNIHHKIILKNFPINRVFSVGDKSKAEVSDDINIDIPDSRATLLQIRRSSDKDKLLYTHMPFPGIDITIVDRKCKDEVYETSTPKIFKCQPKTIIIKRDDKLICKIKIN